MNCFRLFFSGCLRCLVDANPTNHVGLRLHSIFKEPQGHEPWVIRDVLQGTHVLDCFPDRLSFGSCFRCLMGGNSRNHDGLTLREGPDRQYSGLQTPSRLDPCRGHE